MRLPKILTPHVVHVRDLRGRNVSGPVYGPERTIEWCKVDDVRRLTRDQAGNEVISTAQVVIRPESNPPVIGSEVTLWKGEQAERTTTIIQVAHLHHPPAPEHYVVFLA